MGDRANIAILQHPQGPADGRIYLYTHWWGNRTPVLLQRALVRGKSRWADETYLARVIFNEMTRGEEMGTTGYGISTYPIASNYPLLIVDAAKRRAAVDGGLDMGDGLIVSFADYCEISLDAKDPWGTLGQYASAGTL